ASIQHAARVFHPRRLPPCTPSANDSPTAAAPRSPSASLLPHMPTHDKIRRLRCTSPPEIPLDDASSNTPSGTKCPHTSRRALCKNRSPRIFPPSSRFLRAAGWSAPSFLPLSGIFHAIAHGHFVQKTSPRLAE